LTFAVIYPTVLIKKGTSELRTLNGKYGENNIDKFFISPKNLPLSRKSE